MFITLEGLDGSGKETQAKLLKRTLEAKGVKTGKISFPRYGQPSAAPVEEYLSGGYGSKAVDVNAYGASSLFAVDRLASYLSEWRPVFESCDVFIADRYTTSNAIHQLSKLPNDQWDGFAEWLFDYEYRKLGLPEPDLVVYLQIDCATSQKLLERRYNGDASKRDVHERDLAYLERSRLAAEWCANQFGWVVVTCAMDGVLRERNEVHDEIVKKLGL